MHHRSSNGSFNSGSGGKTTSRDEEELDKLLLGLDKLTETLPDLNSSNSNSGCNTSTGGTPTYTGQASKVPAGLEVVQKQDPAPIQQDTRGRSRPSLATGTTAVPSSAPAGHYQSRDNYSGGLSTLKQAQQPQTSSNMEATLYQPYHTRADSKVSKV